MTTIDAFVLGIVEGITEFLPVSSTGHLILTSTLLNIPDSSFLSTFEISIQLGAMCAVVALYWKSFLNISIVQKIVIAFVPTAIIGFLAYPFVKTVLFGSEVTVVYALAIGGFILILFELMHTHENTDMPVSGMSTIQSFWVGVFQSLAVVPGVSRSAATIVGGLLVGIPRATIVEFSFLLAVPTIAAATGLDLIQDASQITQATLVPLMIGFVTSFLVALAAIRFLLAFIARYNFIAFGIYRIVAALLFFLLVL